MTGPANPPVSKPADDSSVRRLPRSIFCENSAVKRDLDVRDIAAAVRESNGSLWVDVDANSRQQVALLDKVFGFHHLTIEDVLNPRSRAKVEEYDGYVFVIIRAVRFVEHTEDPYDLETVNLCMFIGRNYLVTCHAGPAQAVNQILELSERSPDLVARGPARLAHQIMDVAVDAYFPILDRVDEFINGLEERVFERFNESALRDIFAVKRLTLTLRRYLTPHREIFNVLSYRPSALLPADVQVYFRDVYDHMLRIIDSLDAYRDLLSSTLESYLSQVSNRLGLITKGLSIVATLSVPFVVVSGMYGMNFERIPLASHPWGFEILVALQLALGIGLVAVLKWRKWI
ncbi:MAG TPA: magnesium/cobalt transporter CorA [Gemmatimonadaceae bacterium]|nr:magnesium/cobalt transporter CorA [Gemmatimonadaceae bacterium]